MSTPEEIAVCNLASLCLPSYLNRQTNEYDFDKLGESTRVLVRNLNQCITKSFYPVEKARRSNFKTRPLGIGVMGLHTLYMMMRFPFDSEEAKKINNEIFETIYYYAVLESVQESKKYGQYERFDGSPASKGKLQFDLWGFKPSDRYNWDKLRKEVCLYGMRNSLLTSCQPTASTAQIQMQSESIEPINSNLYSRKVLSGEYILLNKFLVNDLIKIGKWDQDMINNLIAYSGSIKNIPEIPDNLKELYKTVWDMSMKTLIDQSAERATWIDQTQSLNIFIESPTTSKLSSMWFYGWRKGLKTSSYYVRSRSKVNASKFAIDAELEKKAKETEELSASQVCSINNKEMCLSCAG